MTNSVNLSATSLIFSPSTIVPALKSIHVTYDVKNGTIQIDYPNTYTLVRYLLDYVRPVGVAIELRSVVERDINTDVMLIYADIENMTREYNPNIDSAVGNSYVNFSSVGDEDYKNNILEKFSNTLGNNSTFSFTGGE